jgi:hypothetical protein
MNTEAAAARDAELKPILEDNVGDALSRDRTRIDRSQDPGTSRWRVECNVSDACDEAAGDRSQVKERANG